MVLATDMSSHFQQIKAMKNILNHSDNFNADKSKILSLVIHISDISHPAKEWELHSTWTRLLMEEFFRQGDREKELNLECSPLCDRDTTLVAESQLGFIEFIVSPSLEVCGDVLDRVHYQMAEANARPVPPASAKAASVVAAAAASAAIAPAASNAAAALKQQAPAQLAIEHTAAAATSSKALCDDDASSSSSAKDSKDKITDSRVQCEQARANSASANQQTTSSPQPLSPAESLTSNLRKIIVSSSASIGRKLNLGSSNSNNGSSSSASTPPPPPPKPPLPPAPSFKQHLQQPTQSKPAETDAEFETRQASYQHPVIKCDLRPRSAYAAAPNTTATTTTIPAPTTPGRLKQSHQDNDDLSSEISSGSHSNAFLDSAGSEASNTEPAATAPISTTVALQQQQQQNTRLVTHDAGAKG